MTATLDDGEDAGTATKQLQAQAEGLVEDHKRAMLESIESLHRLSEQQAELRGLQRTLTDAQERIEAIRQANPELKLLPG